MEDNLKQDIEELISHHIESVFALPEMHKVTTKFKTDLTNLIHKACNQARIDELEIVRWAAVCADAPYINENDRAGFNAVKEQVTNHIDDRIKELKELNNEL